MVVAVVVAVSAIVVIVLFAPLVLLYLDRVFHVYYFFDSLYLWTVTLGLVANDVVNYLVGLVLQL